VSLNNWKKVDGEWGNGVVAMVAICGILFLAGLYYLFKDGMEGTVVTHNEPIAARLTTTGTGMHR